MRHSIEIVVCTVVTSVLSALIPAMIWSMESDMTPCGHITKVVSVSGKYGVVLQQYMNCQPKLYQSLVDEAPRLKELVADLCCIMTTVQFSGYWHTFWTCYCNVHILRSDGSTGPLDWSLNRRAHGGLNWLTSIRNFDLVSFDNGFHTITFQHQHQGSLGSERRQWGFE